MEIKIIKEEPNPLFNRREILGLVNTETTPSKKEVLEFLSEKYSVPFEAIRILKIHGKFGIKEFEIIAHIYPSQEERDKIENFSKKEKELEKKIIEEKNKPQEENKESEEIKPKEAKQEEKSEEQKTKESEAIPAEKEIGINPVEEAKKIEEKKQEEDKKEKQKTQEEKLNE